MQVAWSCVATGTKLVRYKEVALVRVPDEDLHKWREADRERCESDALMPRFAPGMRYALATKTHFTHAQKNSRKMADAPFLTRAKLALK